MTVEGRDDVDVGASVASIHDLNTKVVVRQARHRLINTIAQKRNREGGARDSRLLWPYSTICRSRLRILSPRPVLRCWTLSDAGSLCWL